MNLVIVVVALFRSRLGVHAGVTKEGGRIMHAPTANTPGGWVAALRDRVRRVLAVASGADTGVRSYEEVALDILRTERSVSLAALVERVAEEAMRNERIAGGATLDIAVWGPTVYRAEAIETVKRMLGRSLVLEGEGPHLLAAPVTGALASFAPRPRLAWAVGDGCWHT